MPTTIYTAAEVDALIKPLADRVTALEAGVDPPPTGDSPNHTEVTMGGTIVHRGFKWKIEPNAQVSVDGVPDTTTANVVRLFKSDPLIAQQNTAGNWFSKQVPTDAWTTMSGPPAGWVPPPVVLGPGIQPNKGAPRPTVASGPNAITVDLTRSTGAVWCKAVSGCAAQGLDNITWGGQYRMLLDPAFQAACADLGFRFVRINGLGAIRDAFGPSANSATPNWQWMDNIIAGFDKTFPAAQFCMSFAGNGDFDFNNASIRANFANAVKQTVQRFRDHGLAIEFIGGINEPDAGGTPPKWSPAVVGATIAQFHAAMPSDLLAGPFTSWSRTDFATAAAQATAKLITWHNYNHPNTANAPSVYPNAKIWADAAGFGDSVAAMQAAARAGGMAEPICALTEYNLDWTPGANNDPRQQTWEGAIYTSLLLMSGVYGGLAGATIWRAENFDATYGVFKTGTLNKNPNGALLQAMNRYVGGDVVPLSIASAGGKNLLAAATRTDSDFALVVTNYDSTPWTGPIAILGRTSTAPLTRFDLNATAPLGLTGSIVGTGNVTLPGQCVTILAGAR